MLAETSQMAASGARTLAILLSNASRDIEAVSELQYPKRQWPSLGGAFSDVLGFNYDLEFPGSSASFDHWRWENHF
jgi:hypothetical protein